MWSGNIRGGLWLAIWLVLVAGGFLYLWRYNMAPGAVGEIPMTWPEGDGWSHSRDKLQLLMFVHPQCACSRASMEELSKLIRQSGLALAVRVVFVQPAGLDAKWAVGDLREQAAAIPGVEIVDDARGRMAAQFGAETSGATYVYAPDGHLVFNGGITAARGHFGDNVGSLAIGQAAGGGKAAVDSTPVFGCPLVDQNTGGGR